MGRAPCCDKSSVKKGPWSPEEDSKLKSYIEQHGTGGNWIALPQKIGLRRCGKSCRLRWLNYLRPNLKHGGFSEEEDNIICSLYITIGSRWSVMAAQLPGRTDNDIKNYWNTRLKKKLLGKQRRDGYQHQTRRGPKQLEPKKEEQNGSLIILNSSGDTAATTGYWPDLTLPSHKQALIRKLMMKLEAGIPPFVAPDNSHHGPNTSLMTASVQPISPFTGCLPVQAGDFSIELDDMFGGNQVRVEGFDSCYGLPEGMEGEITELLGMPEAVMSWSGVSPLMRPNMGPAGFASYRGSML